jgi:hypothetical protein
MEGRENDRRRLAGRGARIRILVGARKRRDEKGPAGKAEQLDGRREHPDRCRDRDELEPVAREHLSEYHRERSKQDGGQHEAVPEQLQPQPARLEAVQDRADRTAEDAG